MNWIQLLSCLAQELVKGPVSEALPKPKALEGEYRGITNENHSPSHPHPPHTIRAASKYAACKIPKKTSHHLLEVTDFIFTTTELEHNQGKKRQFHLRVSLMDRTVQKRVGTGDKEDKTHLLLLKTA